MTATTAKIEHNKERRQYRLEVAPNEWASVDYQVKGDTLHLVHSEVPASMRGKGVGSQLMEAVLHAIESEGKKVKPVCSYIRLYMQRHHQWQHLLAD